MCTLVYNGVYGQQVRALRKDTGSANPREGIVRALREHPEGLTLKDIAELTGSHRHTVTKYVYELIGARVILERDVGAAKLCYLMETYQGREAHASGVMKGSLGFRQSWKGQAQLLTLLVALLLVPAGMIAAQSLGNTTATDGMTVATGGIQTATNGVDVQQVTDAQAPIVDGSASDSPAVAFIPDAIQASGESEAVTQSNETPSEDVVIIDTQNETIEELANETVPDETVIPAEGNVTAEVNATAEDNATIGNETGEEPIIVAVTNETATEDNVTVPDENVTIPDVNGTVPEANETVPEINETVPEVNVTITGSSEVEVFIENPAKITRGQDFTARALVRNTGDGPAQNATLQWILPEGFSIASGNAVESIGTIAAGEEKFYDIMVRSSVSAPRGTSEIRARVAYE